MDPITTFWSTGELPTDKAEVRCIKYKALKYHLIDGIRYRRGYSFPTPTVFTRDKLITSFIKFTKGGDMLEVGTCQGEPSSKVTFSLFGSLRVLISDNGR